MIKQLLTNPVTIRGLILEYPCLEYLYKAFTRALLPLDYKELVNAGNVNHPPVFIIGTPRSGSTLLYQLMVHRFHVAYFPNIATLLNTIPILATKLGLKYCELHVSDFTGSFGLIKGCMAPAEAGRIWNRWYLKANGTPVEYLDDKVKHTIYQTVSGIEKLFEAPLISKNSAHSMHIQSLLEIFPKALFIQIKRNPLDVAISILKVRKKLYKNINYWWSAKPREFALLRDRNYLEQICGQVFYIEKNIEESFAVVGKERLHVIHYEELCANPNRPLNEISAFICSHGGNIRVKFEVPESFKMSGRERKKLNHEESAIREILTQYYKEYDF